jgi:hypothetical protein
MTVLDFDTVKGVSEILANAATTLAAIAAAWWFYASGRFSKRVEFDVEFNVFESDDQESKMLQVIFKLDNKGQVEHRCHTLAYEVVELRQEKTVSEAEGFVFRSGNIVEKEAEYYYVRPGVCQRIVTTLNVPSHVKLAKVRAFFTYDPPRIEIDSQKPILPQRYGRDDWTSLVRVVDITAGRAALQRSEFQNMAS